MGELRSIPDRRQSIAIKARFVTGVDDKGEPTHLRAYFRMDYCNETHLPIGVWLDLHLRDAEGSLRQWVNQWSIQTSKLLQHSYRHGQGRGTLESLVDSLVGTRFEPDGMVLSAVESKEDVWTPWYNEAVDAVLAAIEAGASEAVALRALHRLPRPVEPEPELRADRQIPFCTSILDWGGRLLAITFKTPGWEGFDVSLKREAE